jgi:glycosyltransferase involved in cell wall biosynthesis
MRLVLVSQEVPPETAWGGIGTYVDVLSEAMAAAGVEVHVLSTVPGQETTVRRAGGVTVHRFGQPRFRGIGRMTGCPETTRRLWTAASVARLLGRFPGPASVECPEWQAEGLLVGLRRSVPLVVRLHSAARQLFPYTGQGGGLRGVDGRLAMWMEETSARRAHVVVSTRPNLAEIAPRLAVDPGSLHAIPYPVRLPPRRDFPPEGPPRVVFVGRLEPRKGPEVLLRSAPSVIAAVPEARFVFVGRDGVADGAPSSTAWLRAEGARLGIGDRLEFTGPLDTAGVQEQLTRAAVCAFPSRWESFGNVVAEAAAVGRPVVASTIPPFADLVRDGKTGRRVPVDDPEAWATAIVEALTDRARSRTMGAAGSDLVRALCDPAVVARQTLDAHRDAVERCAAGRRAHSSRAAPSIAANRPRQ